MKRHLSILLAILMAFMFLSCEPETPIEKVKVTIDIGIGEPEVIEVDKGSEYTIPEKTREGRTALHVLDDAGAEHTVGDRIVVAGDMKLTWVWDKYLVTVIDGSDKTETFVDNGSDFTFPDFAEKEGKWASYAVDISGNKLVLSSVKEVKEDRTYTIVRAAEPYRIDPDNGTIIAYLGAETEVTLPISVAGIAITGVDSFNAAAVTEVVIPESYKTIGNKAFYNHDKLETVSFPSTLESIGASAFALTGIQSVDISMTRIETLENKVFHSSLTSLKLPATLKRIESQAIKGNLSTPMTVVIPDTVEYVAESAFFRCTTEKITLEISSKVQTEKWPEGWNSGYEGKYKWGDVEVKGNFTVRKIKNADNTDAYEIVSENTENTEIVIPGDFEGLPVIAIFDHAFANRVNITKVTFPASIRSIGYRAFSNCVRLNDLVFEGNGPARIGGYAFYQAPLVNVSELPAGIESIDYGAFSNCSFGSSLKLNEGVISIGDSAFYYCGFKQITLPSSLRTIGEEAFRFSSLEKVVIPEGVEVMGSLAFAYMSNLTEVSFPGSLTVIPQSVLSSDSKLTTLVLNEGIKDISSYAFQCEKLKEVKLPESLEKISGSSIFYSSSIESLEIPSGVKEIKGAALSSETLKTVKFKRATPPTVKGDLSNTLKKMTFYVPEDSVEAYKTWAQSIGLNTEKVMVKPVSTIQ